MRIVIVFDGSTAATAALQDLRRAGFPDDTFALVVSVADPESAPTDTSKCAAVAEAGKAAVSREFLGWSVTTAAATGSPPLQIIEHAREFNSELIILGESENTGMRSNGIFGETSRAILKAAEFPVRIARKKDESGTGARRILVGFDGSAAAAGAVESIARRNWSANTRVRLLAVADSTVMGSIGRFTPQMNDAAIETKFTSQWAETLADEALNKLASVGLSASVQIGFGHPCDVLAAEAEKWDADSIFVGSHASVNALDPHSIGSVSLAIAARAFCSVEVVRP